MIQTMFMGLATTIGIVGSFVYLPFVGLAVYIEFAVLRPQYLWRWALPYPPISWSFYVAVATIAATFLDTLFFGRRSGRFQPGDYPPARTIVTWGHVLFFGFGIWIFICQFTARNPATSDVSDPGVLETNKRDVALAHEEYLKMFVMCTIAWWVVRRPVHAWTIVMLYYFGISYIAYEVNMEYLMSGRLSIYSNGYGGLDNNGAGLLLALGVPVAVMVWERYRRWYRWLFLLAVPILLHAIMLTFSRGAMLSVLVASPLSLYFGRSRRVKIALLILMSPGLLYAAGPEIQARFFSTKNFDKDDSAQSRFGSWKAAFYLALQEPVFGCGTRQSPLFIKSRDSTREFNADIEGRIVHNQFLQVAADNGFVGLGFYLGSVLLALRGYRRVITKTWGDPHPEAMRLHMAACGLGTALVTFCIGAQFLSLEAFEPQYYLIFLGLQMPLMLPKNISEPAPLRQAPLRRTIPATNLPPWGLGQTTRPS